MTIDDAPAAAVVGRDDVSFAGKGLETCLQETEPQQLVFARSVFGL